MPVESVKVLCHFYYILFNHFIFQYLMFVCLFAWGRFCCVLCVCVFVFVFLFCFFWWGGGGSLLCVLYVLFFFFFFLFPR